MNSSEINISGQVLLIMQGNDTFEQVMNMGTCEIIHSKITLILMRHENWKTRVVPDNFS